MPLLRARCNPLPLPPPLHVCEQVLLPLSQAEVEELSEGVRAEQKKLMASAPTEWNSRPGFASKQAKKKGAAPAAGGEGGKSNGAGENEGMTAVVDEAAAREGGEGAFDDDSSLGLLYRLLLAEMYQGNGASGGQNNRWIDPDALLQVSLVTSLQISV